MLKFSAGKTSQSKIGFMTEVNVVGQPFPECYWGLSYGRSLEESRSRAARTAEALSSLEEAEALLRVANPSEEDIKHYQAWKKALSPSIA
jgi:hypothetical protein